MQNKISGERIKDLIVQVTPAKHAVFDASTMLFEKNILDSYSSVQLILEFERELEIVFDFNDLNSKTFMNINSILTLLEKKYGCVREK
jgi:acyl carrier protein